MLCAVGACFWRYIQMENQSESKKERQKENEEKPTLTKERILVILKVAIFVIYHALSQCSVISGFAPSNQKTIPQN
uniref:Acyl_transf_3 domain-containing protein n=1 Tax=Heterorhabditis bacteriophora TaxID=37862 RepID=A0A1I7X2U7_HETBA